MTSREDSYAGFSVGAILDALAAGTAAPAAGSAVALVLAQAAALCAKSARLSARQLTAGRAAQLTTEAEQIRGAAASLIDEDPRAYQAVIEEKRRLRGESGGTAGRSAELAAALSDAADVPMRMVELAVSVASAAAVLASEGNPALRGDAITACLLAQAAGRAAAILVNINLADAQDDPRLARADTLLGLIAQSANRVAC
jgi:formiminotetrahydrofolate cyclodeaminase